MGWVNGFLLLQNWWVLLYTVIFSFSVSPRNIKLSSFTLFWITRPMIGLDEWHGKDMWNEISFCLFLKENDRWHDKISPFKLIFFLSYFICLKNHWFSLCCCILNESVHHRHLFSCSGTLKLILPFFFILHRRFNMVCSQFWN
jgi:hypothetical protein